MRLFPTGGLKKKKMQCGHRPLVVQLVVQTGNLEHWGSVGVYPASTGALDLGGPGLAG